MQFKELITVLDNNTYINIVSEKGQWLYEGKVMLSLPLYVNFLLQWRINK